MKQIIVIVPWKAEEISDDNWLSKAITPLDTQTELTTATTRLWVTSSWYLRARAILLAFEKIYLCLFIPNCTRNHVITCTNNPGLVGA